MRLNGQRACLATKRPCAQSLDRKVQDCNTSTRGLGGKGVGSTKGKREGRVDKRKEREREGGGKMENKENKWGKEKEIKENDKFLFLSLKV